MSPSPMLLRSLVAAASVTALAACGHAAKHNEPAARSVTKLVVQQQPPSFVDIELDVKGERVGDLDVFEAPIADSSGARGLLTGTLLTVKVPDSKTGRRFETRHGDLTFILGSDKLLVKGATVYPEKEREMRRNEPQVRAVIGGTGRFVGVDGDVSTVRNDDGTYTHTFRLMR